MRINKKFVISVIIFVLFLIITLFYLTLHRYNNIYHFIQHSPNRWATIEPTFSQDFYKTKEARRIGENLIYYQLKNGGWPKNIRMQNRLCKFDKHYFKHSYKIDKYFFKEKYNLWTATIDNDATTTEIDYLSKLYNVTKDEKYKASVLKGLDYILKTQYPNGGFPQNIQAEITKYQREITFNDNATINIMKLFKKIIDDDKQYEFIDSHTKERIKHAYDLALNCILTVQLSSGMWGAQYDREKLIPCYGRSFEPPSIDSRESASIVMFLMSIENPSIEIVEAIEKSVNWYKANSIKNKELKIVYKKNKPILALVDCNNCDLMWARLYDIEKGIPIYGDDNFIIRYNLSELSQKRMFGYEWYVYSGNIVLAEYKNWQKKILTK